MLKNMAISKFWSGYFVEEMSAGGGLVALQYFWSLKKALELLIFNQMSPLSIFYNHWFDMVTHGKKVIK